MSFHIRVRAAALVIEHGHILLVEFRDDHGEGIHYNLPAGGVEAGESIVEAVRREVMEEASIEVEVGPLAMVYEFEPTRDADKGFATSHPGITLMFQCRRIGGDPQLPVRPDPNEIAVKWISLSQLQNVKLFPNIATQILQYAQDLKVIFVEESSLPVVQ